MSEEIVAVPLLAPAGGTPEPIDTDSALERPLKSCALEVELLLLMLSEPQDLDIALEPI